MFVKLEDIPKGNQNLVGAQGDSIVFLRPVPQQLKAADAANLAIWILALCCVDALSEDGFGVTDEGV